VKFEDVMLNSKTKVIVLWFLHHAKDKIGLCRGQLTANKKKDDKHQISFTPALHSVLGQPISFTPALLYIHYRNFSLCLESGSVPRAK
jgi:hypothetical protein